MATLTEANALKGFVPARPGGRRGFLAATAVLAAAVWLGALAPARAALVVAPQSLSLTLAAGEVGIVRGDITNTTGFDLRSSDFFGSFSGFPSDVFIVDQLLGLTDLAIDDRAITRGLDLFSVQLAAGAQAGQTYAIEYFFADGVSGSFSAPSTLLVTVQGTPQPMPEPGAVSLLGAGLFWLAMAGWRRKTHQRQGN